MSPENRNSAEEAFRELETQLASLRAAAKSLREQRPSRLENIFNPGRQARREADFGGAMAAAIAKLGSAIRQQESKLTGIEGRLAELWDERLAGFKSELDQLRDHQEQGAREFSAAIQEMRQQLEQFAREQSQTIEQLAGGQKDLANELRERIQHVLDEQRVAIRQLSLKASEDAVLSDRARRATELKLEELAKQLPKP